MADTITLPGMGPVKKPYVYAGVGVTAGILIWAYWRRANAVAPDTTASTPVAAAPDASSDYAQYSDASGYNMIYPPSYGTGSYSQYGYDIYGNPIPAPVTSGSGGALTTNSDWATAAESLLQDGGVELSVATTSITRVLGGLSVTSTQRDHFMQAVGVLGQPPQGYPTPIHVTDPGTEPTPPATTTPPPAPTGLKAVPFREHVDLDWNPVPDVQGYTIWADGIRKTSNYFSTEHVWNLKPNTTHRLEVAAFKVVGGQYIYGPHASITVKTKK